MIQIHIIVVVVLHFTVLHLIIIIIIVVVVVVVIVIVMNQPVPCSSTGPGGVQLLASTTELRGNLRHKLSRAFKWQE